MNNEVLQSALNHGDKMYILGLEFAIETAKIHNDVDKILEILEQNKQERMTTND